MPQKSTSTNTWSATKRSQLIDIYNTVIPVMLNVYTKFVKLTNLQIEMLPTLFQKENNNYQGKPYTKQNNSLNCNRNLKSLCYAIYKSNQTKW